MFTASDQETLKTAVRRAMALGLSGPAGMSVSGQSVGADPRPLLGLWPALVAREAVEPQVSVTGDGGGLMAKMKPIRRLYELAFGRSGDKGNIANVSVIARSPEAYAEIKAKITAERVKKHLGPLVQGRVERFDLDNIEALNFVLHGALDGGATRSLRLDGLGNRSPGRCCTCQWMRSERQDGCL